MMNSNVEEACVECQGGQFGGNAGFLDGYTECVGEDGCMAQLHSYSIVRQAEHDAGPAALGGLDERKVDFVGTSILRWSRQTCR